MFAPPVARLGGGGKIVFTSATGRGLDADEARDEDGPFELLVAERIVLIGRSLAGESTAGFLGTGGAGFRLTLVVEDAVDARLGDLGFWEDLLAGTVPEKARAEG